MSRIAYDMAFYIVLIVIVLNLVFGVIIDTFGDLRAERNEKDDLLRNSCFICGLERGRLAFFIFVYLLLLLLLIC